MDMMKPGQPAAGQMPPAQPPAQAQPQGSALPAELQEFLDPGNPVQTLLMDRLMSLQDSDVQAIDNGISDEAALVLKKIIPEVGFVIDFMMGMDAAQQQLGQQSPQPAPQLSGTSPAPQLPSRLSQV